ncbi:MAG: phenylalanine--tRNA ligase subunit beta [Anaerolineae bacterium]|nr:phenylalanine--tRNA ligase subunit beta [Anaerolineae bacterium]
MRVPISWLREYVDIVLPLEELADRLTLAGLEVERIERIGDWWDPERITVGEVVEVRPHPNADRLVIAVVRYGPGEPMAVVTGAPNLKVGDRGVKVAFATAGARIIDGHAEGQQIVTLKPGKIRGVPSEGMVLSEKELGISEEHEGIMELPPDAPVGTPLVEYLGDTILHIELTPNLAHALSITGIAREVAALTGQQPRLPAPALQGRGEPAASQATVEIADPDLCPRYIAAIIRDVQIGPSPFWMQRRLSLAGMRPINNIVDITNYVMLELGQPLHAFDLDLLRPRAPGEPPAIIVRRAYPGEKMTTLDGIERVLDDQMLLITDGGGPVAIAGVMGGLESEVTGATRNILLEAANFYYLSVRRTSQMLKLTSEAAQRFGRGLDPELPPLGAVRAAELMRQYASGQVAAGLVDAYPAPAAQPVIDLDPREAERLLGVALPVERIRGILESLGFGVAATERGTLSVTVPTHRRDVRLPADLMEEVARIYGYDNLPSTLMAEELPVQKRDLSLVLEQQARDVLVGCGLQEIITYSMTNLASVARLAPGVPPPDPESYVRLANPLSQERNVMRQTLQDAMLSTLAETYRVAGRAMLFEVSRVYLPRPGQLLPDEPRRLCIGLVGTRGPRAWGCEVTEPLDFFDLKGIVETLLDRLGVQGAAYEPVEHPTFQPGRAARLRVDGQVLGTLGEVHPAVREAFDLPPLRVPLAELDLEAIIALATTIRQMAPISRYPAVTQDLAVIVDQAVPAARVLEVILQAGGELLRQAVLFDVYRGAQIPPGKVSLAYALTYQAPDRTLTDEEVARIRGRIVRSLEQALGARLRT